MKVEKSLKIILIILLIVLISLISFVGIFVQKGNRVNNILPEFKLGTDLTGSKTFTHLICIQSMLYRMSS